MELFQFEFMRNAVYAALLSSVACGIIGTYVVARRLVSISGSIAHTAFGGVGLGYLLNINPLIAVLPFTIASALGIGIIHRKARISEDTAIGIFWSLGMALGVIAIGFTARYAPDLFGYLFGNILTVSCFDLSLMVILDALLVVTVLLFYRQFEAVAFDDEFSRVRNLGASFLSLLMLVLVAITVVVLIRIVGIILVIALLTMPAAIARQYTVELKKMMVLATVFGLFLTICGLVFSYVFNIASGATIILFSGIVFGCSTVVKHLQGTARHGRN